MTPDPIDHPASTAVQQLQAFGLSTYAARMFVALLQNGVSSARDVSEVADVPRTRVYDAGDELLENDLIDVREESPKHFDPVPAREAIEKLRQEYRYREATLTAVLSMLENENDEEPDVRTVTGREKVVDCLTSAVRAATEEVILVTDGSPLSSELVDQLADAAEEGIQIRVVGDFAADGRGYATSSDGDDGAGDIEAGEARVGDSETGDLSATGDAGNPAADDDTGGADADGAADDGRDGNDFAGSIGYGAGNTLATRIPDVETVTRIPDTTDIPDGKRLLVDGTHAVVTVSVGREPATGPTLAVWGVGKRNLLVEMLKDAITEWFEDAASTES